MRWYWLYIVLEESKGLAHARLNYCGYAWDNPPGRGGAPLSVLAASVSAVLWHMNRHTALTESSSADNGSDRFLSGELGGGWLGPGAEVSLEGDVATGDGWLCCPALALVLAVLAPFSVELSGVGPATLVSVPYAGPPWLGGKNCVDGGCG